MTTFRLAIDGDDTEKRAWPLFIQSSFPAYEAFWLKCIVPVTGRPFNLRLLDDAALTAKGLSTQDVALAQLHYTVLQHLLAAYPLVGAAVDTDGLLTGLSRVCAAQDVGFELLERSANPGKYDPWLEDSRKARASGSKLLSGQDAREAWRKTDNYPLQDYRDYRNKLIHGRVPPAALIGGVLLLPTVKAVDQYCDWRKAFNLPDFTPATSILAEAWQATIVYLETIWRRRLL